MSFDYLTGYIMSISMCMQNFITIFHSVQEIGPFSLFFFRIWNSARPRPIPYGIWQSLGLHLVNINAYANFYQNIPNGLRVIDIFHEQAGDKIFTNRPGTKFSQTLRWHNQLFDYRALYEIELSVSVDFLRVVQLWLRLKLWSNIQSQNLLQRQCFIISIFADIQPGPTNAGFCGNCNCISRRCKNQRWCFGTWRPITKGRLFNHDGWNESEEHFTLVSESR